MITECIYQPAVSEKYSVCTAPLHNKQENQQNDPKSSTRTAASRGTPKVVRALTGILLLALSCGLTTGAEEERHHNQKNQQQQRRSTQIQYVSDYLSVSTSGRGGVDNINAPTIPSPSTWPSTHPSTDSAGASDNAPARGSGSAASSVTTGTPPLTNSRAPSVAPSPLSQKDPAIAAAPIWAAPSWGSSGGEDPSTTGPEPSAFPSSTPSLRASRLPTGSPSLVPTRVPSQVPTMSKPPTRVPSTLPTYYSRALSNKPSVIPSTPLSTSPSASNSQQPSESSQMDAVAPSAIPTMRPSQSPTAQSSSVPSASLSWIPTMLPTMAPTPGAPSVSPSSSPTTTVRPSNWPSKSPSWSPTSTPSVAPIVCPDGLYGPHCEPPPLITSISPNDAFDSGGTVIRVEGLHFQYAYTESAYFCNFAGAGIIKGALIEDGVVECIAPSVPFHMTDMQSSLTLLVDGTVSNGVPFTFFETCPPGYCENGYCSFGVCECFRGFGGETCNATVTAPLVEDPQMTLRPTEEQHYEYQVTLSEGTWPIEWSIVGSRPPAGLSIDRTSGLLMWENPEANSKPTKIQIQARNAIGSHTLEVSFIVLPSYIVRASTSTPNLVHPSPAITFRVETLDANTKQPVGGKPAQVWVRRGQFDHPRKVDTITDPGGVAFVEHRPYEGDRGRFIYGGTHPTYENLSVQGALTIRSINVSPSYHHVSGETYETIVLDDVFLFTFSGGMFTGLVLEMTGGNDALKVETSLNSDLGDQIYPVTLSIILEAEVPVSELVEMTLTSDEGDRISFRLFVDIQHRAPRFRVSPETLDVTIPQIGSFVQKDVVIENIGGRASGEIEIVFSDSTLAHSDIGERMPGLAVDKSRKLTIGFTANEVDVSFFGTILFRSDVASEILHYRATVVPTDGATLTVVAQDEATFFAESRPNLAHATVHIRKLEDGSTWTASTGGKGTAAFEELTEGIYEIHVQKEKHRDFRTSMLLIKPGQTVFAFLQADVASYAFTVIPVAVGDGYVHEIESSYESAIPKPIVVWNPTRPDWEGIRDGRVEEIQLTATNYGTITAENVTIAWPRFWENVEFIFPAVQRNAEDGMFHLGKLPANSSFTFTIGVKRLTPFAIPPDYSVRSASNGVYLEPQQYSSDKISDVIFVPFEDPIGGRLYIQFGEDSLVESIFDNSTATSYILVYDGINIIDIIVSEDASLPDKRRRSASLIQSLRSGTFQCAKQYAHQAICDLDSISLAFCDGSTDSILFAGFYYYSCGSSRREKHDFGGEVSPPYIAWDERLGPLKPDCRSGNHVKEPVYSVDNSAEDDVSDSFVHEGCGRRCLEFGRNPCWPISHSDAERRRLRPSTTHRRLTDKEMVCSEEDVQNLYHEIQKHEGLFLATETMLQSCVDRASSSGRQHTIFACIFSGSFQVLPHIPLLNNMIKCHLDRVPSPTELANRPRYHDLISQAKRFEAFIDLMLLPFSGYIPKELTSVDPPEMSQIEEFNKAFLLGLSDDGEDGRSFSDQELDGLLKIAFVTAIAKDIEQFVVTWNISLYFWKLGVHRADELPPDLAHDFFDLSHASFLIRKFENFRKEAIEEGYSGFTDAWKRGFERKMLEGARTWSQVCARVHLQVEEEIALAGSIVEVNLEVWNSGLVPMENVLVDFQLNTLGNSTNLATDLFIAQQTEVINVSGVDGTGTVAGSTKAKITWSLRPLSDAAPGYVARYDVGGTLTYSIKGVDYLQVLSPDTITVVPNPELRLSYFSPREAYSDDLATPAVEPSIPFQIGLLIENRGYGEARNLQIVTPQTEILADENMEPVDFKIIGSRIGTNPAENALGIDFGNIQGRRNAVAVWDIVVKTPGNLRNHSAVFKYGDLIRDDSLSLVESTATYELSHVVRMTGEHPAATNETGPVDDEVGDFLVNLHPDPDNLPDTVFSSDAQTGTFSVEQIVDEATWEQPVYNAENDIYEVQIKHTEESMGLSPGWVYIRFDDPLGGENYVLQSAKRSDLDYELIPQFNSWQTSLKERLEDGSSELQYHVHLFDLGVAAVYTLRYARQEPVSGLRVNGATEHSLTLGWDGTAGAASYYVVYKPSSLSDEYYKPAVTFTQDTSVTITNLAAETSYDVRVYNGAHGKYENAGASIVVQTFGVSHCGDEIVDVGEECDDGARNGRLESNCTYICFSRVRLRDDGSSFLLAPGPTVSPAPTTLSPSEPPSESPSKSPTSRAPTKVLPVSDPAEEAEVCPVSDSCDGGKGERFWVSKYDDKRGCRLRCLYKQKAKRSIHKRDFTCGRTCDPTDNSIANTTNVPKPRTVVLTESPSELPSESPTEPIAELPSVSPTPQPSLQPTVKGQCRPDDSCSIDLEGNQGYWMSFLLFGETCARRCMRLEQVAAAKDRGYVCGAECDGLVDMAQQRNKPAPENEANIKDVSKVDMEARRNVFRRGSK